MKDRQATQERPLLPVADRRRRERRLWRLAFLASLATHVLVFIAWRHQPIPLSPFAAAGPRVGDDRAAKGGGLRAMNLSTRRPSPIVQPPPPLPTPDAVIDPVEIDFVEPTAPSGLEGLDPGLDAPGLEKGEGRGDGGTAEEGLNRLTPPSPRGMIIPPTNDELKGSQVEVWVFVDARGRVVPDSTWLRPPTSDDDFNERLIREASQWVFEPARKGGVAVGSWFPYTISM